MRRVMPRMRRESDPEFRAGAVRIVEETGCPVAFVAREVGVGEGALGNWVRGGAAGRTGVLTAGERVGLREQAVEELGLGEAT